MMTENRTWGAPRVHGELKMLGFDLSERIRILDRKGLEKRSCECDKIVTNYLANYRNSTPTYSLIPNMGNFANPRNLAGGGSGNG